MQEYQEDSVSLFMLSQELNRKLKALSKQLSKNAHKVHGDIMLNPERFSMYRRFFSIMLCMADVYANEVVEHLRDFGIENDEIEKKFKHDIEEILKNGAGCDMRAIYKGNEIEIIELYNYSGSFIDLELISRLEPCVIIPDEIVETYDSTCKPVEFTCTIQAKEESYGEYEPTTYVYLGLLKVLTNNPLVL